MFYQFLSLHRAFWNYAVHSPTNALFIKLVKSFKFTLQYKLVSFFTAHNTHAALRHAATSPNIYIKRRNFTECFNINITIVSYS